MKISSLGVVYVLLLGATAGRSDTVRETPNRLARESSPYLRLHAYNPVDWYPWGDEAFERARQESKPIFLSVGYSTCYWCHVMERLVFSDPAIAELMNRWFVNIKVDREERPDIDEIYMTTTQLLTGRGGWPNSVFLTPQLKPFFAGTYFPPEDQEGRPGFPTVLTSIARAWNGRRDQIETQATRLAEAVQETLSPRTGAAGGGLPAASGRRAVAELKKRFDPEWGGFGDAPKFPSPANLFLLWWQAEGGDEQARGMVLDTLAAMGRGAIYDQLEGGFHRYTLDRAWRIPHFEKMLYDNALLAEILVTISAATDDADLERLARGTLDFLLRVMRLPNGAFKSAIDAETEAVEGAFYIWDRRSLDAVLGAADANFLAPLLGYDSPPNFESHAYTLYLTDSFEHHAERLGMSRAGFLDRVEPLLDTLARARAQRPFPLVDDKVLTDWNGMAIAAFAQGGRLFGEERYTMAAVRVAEFVLGMQDSQGRLLHVWNQGQAKQPAFLDDYAFLIHGLLQLHRATGEARWLDEAERLTVEMERQLREPSGRYFTSPADPKLLVRSSSANGGAIPAGNGMAIVNLQELAELSGRPIYRARALSAIQSFSAELEGSPGAMPTVARAVLMADRAGPGIRNTLEAAETGSPSAENLVTAQLHLAPDPPEKGWSRFALTLSIREGWHINANPASLELLIPTQIEGDLRAVEYPRGMSMRPAFAAEEIKVYRGRAEIEGEILMSNPELQLTFQACDDRRCLPPVTREVHPAKSAVPE